MEIDDESLRLAASAELPILRLLRRSRLPTWAFGAAWGLLLFGIMVLPYFALDMDPSQQRGVLVSALFFSVSIAIITGAAAPVFYGAANDLRELGPVLSIDGEARECLARGLVRATPGQVRLTLLMGVILGIAHSYLLGHHLLPIAIMLPQIGGTMMLWIFMHMTVVKLIINALVFSRLGAVAEPDLLRPSRHAGFGTAALRPALFIIGTLCAYVLLVIGESRPVAEASWIGAALSVISMVGIVTLPLRGIRRRISERREAILRDLDDRLEAMADRNLGTVPPATLRDMDTILDMRERVAQAPGWPLDLAGVRRILLYIVLPPLTWAAAAIVEMMIDSLV
ncbi:MAG: hypothetical protein V2I82_12930 [Halieaceae bacterium]|nr:hypothetical protein [Halieaceae bacterium]